MTSYVTEEEKFKVIVDAVIKNNPDFLTTLSLVGVLMNHIAWKMTIGSILESPEAIKEKQEKLEEFTVNIKDYLKFKQGRP